MTRVKSILLVDDDPDDVELFKTALTKVADSVYLMTANSGNAALSLLSHSVILPDVIFMDINMPGLNWFDTISELKKNEAFRISPLTSILLPPARRTGKGKTGGCRPVFEQADAVFRALPAPAGLYLTRSCIVFILIRGGVHHRVFPNRFPVLLISADQVHY